MFNKRIRIIINKNCLYCKIVSLKQQKYGSINQNKANINCRRHIKTNHKFDFDNIEISYIDTNLVTWYNYESAVFY